MVLHSFKNLGGTNLSPADKFVCLMGVNQTAPAIIVNESAISDNCEFVSPTDEDILNCSDLEELLALQAPITKDTDDTMIFLPTPWLLNVIMEAQTDNPFKLILAAKEGATRFNQSQLETDPTYVPSTAVMLHHFVKWAWGVKRNKVIPHTSFYLDPNDDEVEQHQTSRHQLCIQAFALPLMPQQPAGIPPIFHQNPNPILPHQPLATTNDAILQQLANSISRQSDEAAVANELMTRQLEFNIEKDDKKKDRIKKLHQSVKQLLLFASADDADSVPDEPLESCKRFINAKTDGIANQELNIQFKH